MTSDFVAADFDVPRTFAGSGYRLEPLGPEHNERDFAAWTSSMDHIHGTPGFGGEDARWPRPMPIEENLADLEMHARHFVDREGFTYTVLDGDEVIGCVYIYPSGDDAHDADIRSWVTESRADLDAVLWREVSAWLSEAWPFTNPFQASRSA